jgi:hypothetical protein
MMDDRKSLTTNRNHNRQGRNIMKGMGSMGLLLVSAFIGALLGGCAGSYQARSVELTENDSPLVNPDILKKSSGEGEALYRYVNPDLDIKKYTKIIVEPVLVRKDGKLDEEELKNYQTLANNAYVYLTKALEKDYQIVQSPEPGTLRVQMAIVDADPSAPVRNALSTFMPIGMGISLIKYAATGKQSGVGEITVEMKVTDAESGELLGAALDRRVGGKDVKGIWDTWFNADAALQYWAQKLAYTLCGMRGGTDCIKPED